MKRWSPAAILLVILTGCGQKAPDAGKAPVKTSPPASLPSEAAQFYEAVTAVHQRLLNANREFTTRVNSYMMGQNKDFAGLKAAQAEFAKSVEAAKAELKAMKLPDLKGAQQLHQAQARYVEGEEAPLRMQTKLVEMLDNALNKGEAFNPVELGKTFTAIEEARQKVRDELDAAVEAFIKEHNLKVKRPQ
jgi:hypothetical protein